MSVLIVSCLICQGGYFIFDLPFLANVPIEALLHILCILCQIQLQLWLSISDPISTHPGTIPIFFSRYMSLVPLPVHFLLSLQFDQRVLTEPCQSPAFLVQFLIHGK